MKINLYAILFFFSATALFGMFNDSTNENISLSSYNHSELRFRYFFFTTTSPEIIEFSKDFNHPEILYQIPQKQYLFKIEQRYFKEDFIPELLYQYSNLLHHQQVGKFTQNELIEILYACFTQIPKKYFLQESYDYLERIFKKPEQSKKFRRTLKETSSSFRELCNHSPRSQGSSSSNESRALINQAL